MSRTRTPDELFQRPHWSPAVRETSMPLRMFWVHLHDREFRFTESELAVLWGAAAGEDVGIRFLDPQKARGVLGLFGLLPGGEPKR